MMRNLFSFFLLALLVGPAVGQSSGDLVDRLQSKYDSLTALEARFEQVSESEFLESRDRITGTLVLSGPMYRLEMADQIVVTDFVTTWVYNIGQQQVLISDYEEDESTFSVNEFLTGFDDRFEVTDVSRIDGNGGREYELELRPLSDFDFFREVTVWMRDADDLVSRVRVRDANDTVMTFELKDVIENPPIDAGTFRFQPPDGVEIIDLRS